MCVQPCPGGSSSGHMRAERALTTQEGEARGAHLVQPQPVTPHSGEEGYTRGPEGEEA